MARERNRLDLVRIKARHFAHRQRAIDGVVDGPRAGIGLELDQQLKRFVDAFDQLAGEVFIGERFQKAALTLENGIGAGETELRHQRGGHAVTRCWAGVEPLLHRRAIHFHQARRLSAGHAERVGDLRGVQFQQLGCRDRGAKHAAGRRGVKCPVAQRIVGSAAHALHHFATRSQRGNELLAACVRGIRHGQRRRIHRRAEVKQRQHVNVVQLDAVRGNGIGDRKSVLPISLPIQNSARTDRYYRILHPLNIGEHMYLLSAQMSKCMLQSHW